VTHILYWWTTAQFVSAPPPPPPPCRHVAHSPCQRMTTWFVSAPTLLTDDAGLGNHRIFALRGELVHGGVVGRRWRQERHDNEHEKHELPRGGQADDEASHVMDEVPEIFTNSVQ
jgi:hypothetical protein